MKKVVFFVLVVLCANTAFGQKSQTQPKKVAVYITGEEEDGLGEFVAAYLVNAITHNDGYTAVERTAEFLKVLNKEQEYQRTGMVDDEQIAKLGKQFGTKLVCVVKIGNVNDKPFIQARLLEAETATVRNSTKPFLFTLDDLEDVCASVAIQLLTENKNTRSIQSVF